MAKKLVGYVVIGLVTAFGVADCYRTYVSGHSVRTLAEYCEAISGVDLNRKHNVNVLSYDCAAVRQDFEAQFEEELRRTYLREAPGEDPSEVASRLVSVSTNGRGLFVTYRGQSFNRRSLIALITHADPGSCWDDAVRTLFDVVSAEFAFFEQITLPIDTIDGPCGAR